jgi:hypothetical protein
LIDLTIMALTISIAFGAHLIEIAFVGGVTRSLRGISRDWNRLLPLSRQLHPLGYGDLIMSPAWKLLGPLDAADGALMFGVSTAMIFAVTTRLILARYVDLRN